MGVPTNSLKMNTPTWRRACPIGGAEQTIQTATEAPLLVPPLLGSAYLAAETARARPLLKGKMETFKNFHCDEGHREDSTFLTSANRLWPYTVELLSSTPQKILDAPTQSSSDILQ